MKGLPLHEAIAAAVRRRYPQLTVTSDSPPARPSERSLDVKGGTKKERDEAMAFARRYAEGWMTGRK